MPEQVPDALRATDLAIGYGRPLVEAIGLAVRPGELVAVLGPNGAGKSTLLRCLAGIQAPLHGRVSLGDTEVRRMRPRDRARCLALVQSGRPRVPLSVADMVGLGRAPHTGWTGRLAPADEAAVDRALRTAGIDELRDRPCSTLSDGEAQRAVVARCLAQEAGLLLLDEPTAHLDAPARVEILSLLLELTRDCTLPRGVVVTLHELDLAFRIADRIWLLGEGTITTGAPEDLILDGSVGRVFSRGKLVFDPAEAAFRPPSSAEIPIRISGRGLGAIWTRRAVRRIGFSPSEEDGREVELSVRVVELESRDDGARRWRWELETPVDRTSCRSIGELLGHLQGGVAEHGGSR